MPDPDSQPTSQLAGPLARLDGARDELAKAWLVRLIERASLAEIGDLPTERIAAELPGVISDVLAAVAGEGPWEPDAGARERAARLVELRRSGAGAPGEVARDIAAIGAVVLDALRRDGEELAPARFTELAIAVAEAVGAVQSVATEELVARRTRELEATAGSDPLTGLADLRNFEQTLRHALALHARYGHPFALLALDVDGLDRINDSRGRDAGDRVLVQVALAVRRAIRTVDAPARIGPDEFGVLIPHQNAEEARGVAGRLARAARAETAGADGPQVHVAIGVVSCPGHGTEAAALLEAADTAMFAAKAAGEPFAVGGPVEPLTPATP